MRLWTWVKRPQSAVPAASVSFRGASLHGKISGEIRRQGVMESIPRFMVFLVSVLMLSGCAHTAARTGEVPGGGGRPEGQAAVRRFAAGPGAGRACVRDNKTGLTWVKSPDVKMRTWFEALVYVKSLDLCGYSDWRVPTVAELQSLVNEDEADTYKWLDDPAQGFSNVQPGNYWSSDTLPKRVGVAWGVNMQNGTQGNFGKPNILFVWPVRGRR